jgi:capsular polysaccharide transport system permease protein
MLSNMTSDLTRRPTASALTVNLAVVSAVLLRDIRVRAGAYYTGFIIVLLMPLIHLVTVVTLFKIFNRVAPVGTNPIVYFGLSILPYVTFSYLSRQIVVSLSMNKPLLFFHRVKIFDIFLARGLLESVNSIVVFMMVMSILYLFSDDFAPRDWAGMILATLGTIYLGFSIGVANGLIALVVPFWMIFFNVLMPGIWVTSGIIFFPSAIPEPYRHWLSFNPILQCVEWMRYSFYEDYPGTMLNIPYLFGFSTIVLAASLIVEKLSRRVFLSR